MYIYITFRDWREGNEREERNGMEGKVTKWESTYSEDSLLIEFMLSSVESFGCLANLFALWDIMGNTS